MRECVAQRVSKGMEHSVAGPTYRARGPNSDRRRVGGREPFAPYPTRAIRVQNCSRDRWSQASCCTPNFASRYKLARWAQVQNSSFLIPNPWGVSAGHLSLVEPLSVTAFVAALLSWKQSRSSGGFVLDIGMNIGWYSWLAHAVSPELFIVGVDMQPMCHEVAKCGLRLQHSGGLPANVQLLRRYASSTNNNTLQLSAGQCEVEASPSDVSGRARAVRKARKRGRNPSAAVPATETSASLVPVRPIMLGPYLLQEFGLRKERAVVVKIDTEGFETRVLESLRPAWPLLGDIVFEMTVSSWEVHGIGVEEGLSTLRDVISANRYRVVTLPHTALGAGRGEAYWTLGEELVDPCRLPHVDPKVSLPANRHWHLGLANATVMHGHHLENLVRMHRIPNGFHEFLLTNRWEGCPLV